MRRLLRIPWVWWRRAVQLALLALFLWLFRRTEYFGSDQLSGTESLLFRLDPLVAASAMLAAKKVVWLCWPALVIVALTLIFGRFFCGWVCPLGTLLDYFHRALRPIAKRTNAITRARLAGALVKVRPARYFLLVFVLLAGVLAVPLVGYVDPFSLLVRAMTFKGDPVFYKWVDAFFGWTADRWGMAGVHRYFIKHALPFRQAVFYTAGVSAAIVGVIFALELVARRFWCRYLCPLGAGLGLLARPSLVKRLPVRVCKNCGSCASDCRMGALEPGAGFSPEACNLCMECVDNCPQGIIKFAPKRGKLPPAPVDLSRRGLLNAAAAGVVVPVFMRAGRVGRESYVDPSLLRPPGAADEKTFLGLCVRCGECMKVCPTNVLQPAILQAGIEGMFSPRLVPRLIFEQSYCEYACTLCGQVCPTGAIPRLVEDAKHKHPTGKAWFDHNRCLPWAKETSCIRCEEMCPVPEKAIRVRNTFTAKDKDGNDVEIQQPFVDRELCVGCGICESNCPIEGLAGIRVRRADAADPGTEFKDRAPAATRAAG
jgi:ferredoxin